MHLDTPSCLLLFFFFSLFCFFLKGNDFYDLIFAALDDEAHLKERRTKKNRNVVLSFIFRHSEETFVVNVSTNCALLCAALFKA